MQPTHPLVFYKVCFCTIFVFWLITQVRFCQTLFLPVHSAFQKNTPSCLKTPLPKRAALLRCHISGKYDLKPGVLRVAWRESVFSINISLFLILHNRRAKTNLSTFQTLSKTSDLLIIDKSRDRLQRNLNECF